MPLNNYKCLNSFCNIHKNDNQLKHPFCDDCAYKVLSSESDSENTLIMADLPSEGINTENLFIPSKKNICLQLLFLQC